MIVNRDDAPKYLQDKYIEEGYLVSNNSITECFIDTLTTWNNQTLSAYTMILLFIIGIICYYKCKNTKPAFIILLHIIIHTPFSITHHCLSGYSKEISRLTQKLDIISIFIAQTLLHYALWYNKLPLHYSIIFLIIFVYITFIVIKKIIKTKKRTKEIGLKYIPIVLLHIIPLIYTGAYDICVYMVILFLTFLYFYKNKIPEKYTKVSYVNSNNVMHIALICLNYAFFYYNENY